MLIGLFSPAAISNVRRSHSSVVNSVEAVVLVSTKIGKSQFIHQDAFNLRKQTPQRIDHEEAMQKQTASSQGLAETIRCY